MFYRVLCVIGLLLAASLTVAETQEKHGDLELSGAMLRATPPNAKVAGGFITITNTGEGADVLVAAQIGAEVAGMTQLHEMYMDNDVMRMREVASGIPIPAGETVHLQPGGLHIMVMNLNAGLVVGDAHDVTLIFEQAGEHTLEFDVLSMSEIMAATKHHQHD